MSVSYDVFTEAFLSKVTEYDFLRLDPYDRNKVIDGFRKRACAQFNSLCKYDLLTGDGAARELACDIPEDEINEIADIISDGMLVQWMKPYYYRADNLENALNTSDFSTYSPAELLYRITNAYKQCQRDFTNRMREYTYSHGDLSDLSL